MTNPDQLKAEADALIAHGKALIATDLPQATDLLNQAVRLYWAAGEYYSAAAQTGNYGWALRRMGRPDLARPYLARAAEIFADLGLTDFAERHRAAAEDIAADLTPEFLASLPPAVRQAIEQGDGAALQFAINGLPLSEQQQVIDRLVAIGLISLADSEEDTAHAVQQFEPLLQAIAAVARGDESERADVEQALDDLERKGWRIRKAVRQIWQGERRRQRLTYGLDEVDTAIVNRILDLLA
ncbi:tetratricopeptide repeat protein [uncultured Chloroflexus sp.]|uniref:tetratricopeptide repeat protein n=2 Tax=uncultured Chloroflexus sp. TaxID=214040 RepID=UPI002604E32B|nr:tetratricopeptide repeat protein [uncultured Chloroflexus sp.]